MFAAVLTHRATGTVGPPHARHIFQASPPPLRVPAALNLFAWLCQRCRRSSCSAHSELIDPPTPGLHQAKTSHSVALPSLTSNSVTLPLAFFPLLLCTLTHARTHARTHAHKTLFLICASTIGRGITRLSVYGLHSSLLRVCVQNLPDFTSFRTNNRGEISIYIYSLYYFSIILS